MRTPQRSTLALGAAAAAMVGSTLGVASGLISTPMSLGGPLVVSQQRAGAPLDVGTQLPPSAPVSTEVTAPAAALGVAQPDPMPLPEGAPAAAVGPSGGEAAAGPGEGPVAGRAEADGGSGPVAVGPTAPVERSAAAGSATVSPANDAQRANDAQPTVGSGNQSTQPATGGQTGSSRTDGKQSSQDGRNQGEQAALDRGSGQGGQGGGSSSHPQQVGGSRTDQDRRVHEHQSVDHPSQAVRRPTQRPAANARPVDAPRPTATAQASR